MILAASGRFAAILLDRTMPRMDGMTLLGMIRGWPETTQIPVIMATALDDKASVLEGLNAGAYYYLTKPLQFDLLLAVVRAAVNQSVERLRLAQLVRQTEQSLGRTFQCRLSFSEDRRNRPFGQSVGAALPSA